MKKYYTPREAADLLGCSLRTIYRRLTTGNLDGIRPGGTTSNWLIPKGELEKCLALKQEIQND